MKTILLFYNPNSGYFVDKATLEPKEYFLHTIKKYKFQMIFFEIGNDSFEDFIQYFLNKDIDEVWIAGGDGTVNTYSKLLKEFNIPIGILPFGTMNLLARDLGMSLDLKVAIEQLVNSKVRLINSAKLNEIEFFCISNFGMSTKLTHYREKLRCHNFWKRLFLLIWYMLKFAFIYPKLNLKITHDDKVCNLKTRSVTITNNLLSKKSSLIPKRNKLDENLIGAYIVKDSSIFSLPRLILRLLLRDWQDDEDMIIIKAKEIEFDLISKNKMLKVMCDGEIKHIQLPLIYKINDEKIAFLAPKEDNE